MAATTLAKGITSGLRAAMEKDPKVVLMGEDIGKLGGVFRVTEGLQKDFGEERVIDTPLAEAGILGTAIGIVGVLVAAAAASGVRSGCRSAFFQSVLQGFGWHGVGHVLISLALRRYTSGVATAPTVVIPYWLWARRALADSDVPLRPTDTKTVALVPPVIIGSIAVARVIGRHTR